MLHYRPGDAQAVKGAGELQELDLGNLTPIDALNKLYQLQNKIKNRW